MQIVYTLTIDDLRDAYRANGNFMLDAHVVPWFLALGLIMTSASAALGAIELSHLRPGPKALLTLVAIVTPVVVAVGVYVLGGLRVLRNLRDPKAPGRVFRYGGWLVAAALLALHVYLAWQQSVGLRRQSPPHAEGASTFELLRPPLLWSGMFAGFGAVMIWFNRTLIRRTWAGDLDFQRPKLMHVTDTGIAVGDAFSRSEYSWPAFLRLRETPNQFMLYIARNRFVMVPKRALTEPGAVDDFRRMVEMRLSPPPAVPAFPVAMSHPWPVPAPIAGMATPPVDAVPFAAVAPGTPTGAQARPPPLPPG
jgi:hypothetical protein